MENHKITPAEMRWYVLRAVSGKEGKVKEYIDLGIKNGHFNGNVSQVLIPTEKVVYSSPNGKRTVKERNSMPGYVLIDIFHHELKTLVQCKDCYSNDYGSCQNNHCIMPQFPTRWPSCLIHKLLVRSLAICKCFFQHILYSF